MSGFTNDPYAWLPNALRPSRFIREGHNTSKEVTQFKTMPGPPSLKKVKAVKPGKKDGKVGKKLRREKKGGVRPSPFPSHYPAESDVRYGKTVPKGK